MIIANTRFWIDRDSREIGIRSMYRGKGIGSGPSPFSAYLSRFPGVLDFSFYEQENEADDLELRIKFKLLWFSLYLLVWVLPKRVIKDDNHREWGWYFIDHSLCLRWGVKSFYWELPFVGMHFVTHELLTWRGREVRCSLDSRFDSPGRAKEDETVKQFSRTFQYRYECDNGTIQSVNATVHPERRTWRRKWTPFKVSRDTIDVRFDGEVGSEAGSWKGGCVGCSYTMLKGESPLQTLRRMERDRRFEK